jgi:hypothetical protein
VNVAGRQGALSPEHEIDLRHTTATLLLKEGVPLAVVWRRKRHDSSSSITSRGLMPELRASRAP